MKYPSSCLDCLSHQDKGNTCAMLIDDGIFIHIVVRFQLRIKQEAFS